MSEYWISAIETEERNGYWNLILTVIMDNADQYGSQKNVMEVTWQASKNHDHYYAGKVEPGYDANDRIEYLKVYHKVLGRLLKQLDSWTFPKPEEVLSIFQSFKYKPATYDPRLHEYVLKGEEKPESFERWRDDHERYNGNHRYCKYHVWARNAEEAQAEIMRCFGEDMADNPHNVEERMLDFINSGKPVKMMNTWGSKIDPRPLEEIIKHPAQRQKKEENNELTVEFFESVTA